MTIEASLAQLAVEIRHLREDITELKADAQRDQDKADESRARVHARLDDVARTVTVLDEHRKADSKRLDSVEVVTNEVRRWKLMGMTSMSIIGIGAAAVGITFADAIKRLLMLLGGRM